MANKEYFTLDDAREAVLEKDENSGWVIIESKASRVSGGVAKAYPMKAKGGTVDRVVIRQASARAARLLTPKKINTDIEPIFIDIDDINTAFDTAMKKHA